MKTPEQKLYCSLDIETSGFDPLKNEILEVGFAFFEVKDKELKIVEEWTQVFKPSGAVAPQIFGLTGISQKELDEAPKFAEYQKFLQEKLGDAIIVGHNIAFDLKFLEAFGLKFSGKTIDTLDLVQWLLPTHHSYNLENLMHTFGISHKEAHRALADSKACVSLLEKLLGVYSALPEKLQKDIGELIAPYNLNWKELLTVNFPKTVLPEVSSAKPKIKRQVGKSLNFKTQTIYNFPLGQDYHRVTAEGLAQSSKKSLLVLPSAQEVLALRRQGLAKDAWFLPESLFSEKKFSLLLKKKPLTPEELKFVLKILVWKNTNWQTQTILDLNLSFFGGQFRNLINGGEIKETSAERLVVCDQATFFYLSEHKLATARQTVICGLNEFESGVVTANIGTKTSWGYINFLLKTFYNPEFATGADKFKDTVNQGLLAGDLFFGLANALLQTDPPGFVNVKISPEFEYEEQYQKIKQAAENYVAKLAELNRGLASKDIERFTGNLQQFFQPQDNRVKWIELSENRCAFLSMPVDISELVKNTLLAYEQINFADSLWPAELFGFFKFRLGLKNFKVEAVNITKEKSTKPGKSSQGDLFSGIKTIVSGKPKGPAFHYLPQTPAEKDLLQIIGKDQCLPAVILFPGSIQLREFYENNYSALKSRTALLSQSASGASNKIFRNFSINPKSLLLCTDKFILKFLNGSNAVEPVRGLKVKTLIICRLPFEQFTHPYQEAVSQSFPNAFMDYALPKALLNFHSLIRFFYGPDLKDVYILDSKLAKDYAKPFKDYFQAIPGSTLSAYSK